MKTIHALIPLGLLGAAAPALAQPTLPPVDSPQPTTTLPDDPEEPPPVVTTQAPPEQPPPAPVVMAPAQTQTHTAPAPQRPTEFAIALGLGYLIGPSDLNQPNITSARLRLPSGLTFEPRVTLGHESQISDDGAVEFETATNAVEVGVNVRYPLRAHNKVDLSLVAGGAVSLTTINPDGDDNNLQINSLGVSWGLALDFWVTQHWNVSFTALNPVLTTTKTTREEGPGVESADSRTTFGAIFDPTLAVMLHLYL